MATTTPTRFYGPAYLSTSAATKYTVPGASNIRLMHIHVSKPASSPANLTISIGTDASATRIYDAVPILDNVTDLFCYYPLATTEFIQAFASVANALNITISGDLIA